MRLTDICRHICHQLPERSFLWLWDPPVLCARCTGFYLGIALGIALLCSLRRVTAEKAIPLLLTALALNGIEIAVEGVLRYDPGNYARSIAGLLLGCAVGIGIFSPLKTLWLRRNKYQ
jgi:uncharacterized membrane protein